MLGLVDFMRCFTVEFLKTLTIISYDDDRGHPVDLRKKYLNF